MIAALHALVRGHDAGPGRDAGRGRIRDDRGTSTWREVADRSHQIARLLREHGLMPGDRVAILDRPGITVPAVIFGVLEAGAAYVPLDPTGPPGRNATIASDAGCSICVGNSALILRMLERAPDFRPRLLLATEDAPPTALLGTQVVALASASSFSSDELGLDVADTELAYVLYTSGSTGNPKGVAISHRAARCFVEWAVETFGLGPSDTVGAFTPLHFDLSVFDLYASAAAGASMIYVPRHLATFPAELGQFIAEKRITVLYTVPSVLTQLVLRADLEGLDLSSLRAVLFAGEVFPTKFLRTLMKALPRARFWNLYGPTETNVCASYEVTEPPEEDAPPTPFGKACAGATIFALSEMGADVSTGEVGELWVAGPVLMEGYLNAEKGSNGLQPDPRADADPGAQAYPTGDLVTVDAEGDHSWVGRTTQTIKSAGYRVEPAEIERTLVLHPQVAEACVFARPHPTLGSEIRAVVVPAPGEALSVEALLAHVAGELPRWMVPAGVELVDALPKTATGKIDRQSLVHAAGSS